MLRLFQIVQIFVQQPLSNHRFDLNPCFRNTKHTTFKGKRKTVDKPARILQVQYPDSGKTVVWKFYSRACYPDIQMIKWCWNFQR